MKTIGFWIVMMTSSEVLAQWKFSGQAGSYLNDLAVPSSTVSQSEKSGLHLDVKLDYKFNSPWRFKSDTTLRTDFVARDPEEFFQFMPRNFYLQRKSGSVLMKAGIQQFAVDGPDIVNPADVINSKNWIDPTNPLALGSPAVSFSQEAGSWNWELFYIPKQITPVLPGTHSPWLPRKKRLPIESDDTTVLIPDNVKYQFSKSRTLNNATDNNFGFILKRKSEKLEAQLLYFNGLSTSPFLLTDIQGRLLSIKPFVIEVDSPVKLTPLNYRHEAIAGTFLLPFESWAIRGGFNFLRPLGSSEALPHKTNLMVLGFEKNMETSLGMVTGIVDYIRQERQNENQISFLRSVFEEAVSFGVRIPVKEETSMLAGVLYDLKGHSSLLKVSINHRLNNSWSLEAGGQSLNGPDDTLIGLYKRHDSYQLKLMYSW